jgi:hypothetical protein
MAENEEKKRLLSRRLEHMQASRGSVLEEQATLDAQVAEHLRTTFDTIVKLQRQRNALSPVYKIPAELLVDIFVECLPRWNEGEPAHRLACSQVCHHWRTVALSRPLLWTYLDLRYPKLSDLVRISTEEYGAY